MVLVGQALPAYKTFKAVEADKPELLRKWAIYWLVFAALDAVDNVTDNVLFWLPLYYEIKLALVVFLWHPRFDGATHVYETMLQPLLARHEETVDQGLDDAATKVKEVATTHSVRALNYVKQADLDLLLSVQQQAGQAQAEAEAATPKKSGSGSAASWFSSAQDMAASFSASKKEE